MGEGSARDADEKGARLERTRKDCGKGGGQGAIANDDHRPRTKKVQNAHARHEQRCDAPDPLGAAALHAGDDPGNREPEREPRPKRARGRKTVSGKRAARGFGHGVDLHKIAHA